MTYHLRRQEKALTDPTEINRVLTTVRLMTVACCLDDLPYLFTVNFGWDAKGRDLWCHCATEGRKLDILSRNSRVCVSVVEDRGYLEGECDHAYKSVILEGEAFIVADPVEKRRGLEILARQQEADPEPTLARFAGTPGDVDEVGIIRIHVHSLSGKQGPKPSKL